MSGTPSTNTSGPSTNNAAAVNASGSGTEKQAASSISKNTDTLGRVDVQGLVNDVKRSSTDVQAQRDLAAAAAKQIEDRPTRQSFVRALEDQGVARKAGFFEQQWQSVKGTATGLYEGGASLVGGVYDLSKMGVQGTWEAGKFGVQYATDGDYRAKANAAIDQGLRTAADVTQRGLTAARDYTADRIANPEKLEDDAKVVGAALQSGADAIGRKADELYDSYDKAHSEAVIQGKTDELAGRVVGRAGFEIGSLLVPVSKLGTLGKGASVASDVSTATKVTKGFDTATDINRATSGAFKEGADQALVRTGDDASRVTRTEESLRAARAAEPAQTSADTTAKFRGEPFAFGHGARSARAEAMVNEAAKASNIKDVSKYVDEIRYEPGSSSYFTIDRGQRVLTIGSEAFGKTKAGQLIEASHELAHAQYFDKFVQKMGRAAAEAEYFGPHRNFGTPLYGKEEQLVERLARMRVRKHLGGLSPQQEAYSTKYIHSWKSVP
jgi:hypothetical protein